MGENGARDAFTIYYLYLYNCGPYHASPIQMKWLYMYFFPNHTSATFTLLPFKILLYYFPRAIITNYYKLAVLRQQKMCFSQFGKLEIWNQDVGRSELAASPLGRFFLSFLFQLLVAPGSPWSATASLYSLPPMSHGIFWVCFWPSFPLFIRTSVMLDYSPPLSSMTSP